MDAAAALQAELVLLTPESQAQFHRELQTLTNTHAAQVAALQGALAAAGAAPGPAAAARPARAPCLGSLTRYDGTKPPPDEWAREGRQQITYYEMVGAQQQVNFVSGHLSGAALDWWESCAAAPPRSWSEVEAGLRERFQPITSAERARTQLDALRQGKMHINEYVAAFRRIVVSLPTTDKATLMHAFRRGLVQSLAVYVYQANPSTIEETYALVARMGSAAAPGGAAAGSGSMMDLAAMGGEYEQPPDESTGSVPVTRDELASAVLAAMQQYHGGGGGVGRQQARSASAQPGGQRPLPKVSGLTPAQVEDYMRTGKCFVCGKAGHSARFCPDRPAHSGAKPSGQKN